MVWQIAALEVRQSLTRRLFEVSITKVGAIMEGFKGNAADVLKICLLL